MSFKDTLSIVLKILNLSSFFQNFKKCFLKTHFLNRLSHVEKTTLYLGLFFKLYFFQDFFNFFIIFWKIHKSAWHVAYNLRVLLYNTTSVKKKVIIIL